MNQSRCAGQLRWIVLATGVAACGLPHGDNLDAHQKIDAYEVPATIEISGTVTERSGNGSVPVAGVTVGAYVGGALSMPNAKTLTAANGAFTLTLDSGAIGFDVMLRATSPSHVDTYRYSDNWFYADTAGIALDVLTPAAYAQLYASTGVTQTPGSAVLELEATDFYGSPIGGAQFVGEQGTTTYDANGVPDGHATMTALDGLGYVLDAAAGYNTLSISSPSLFYVSPRTVTGFAGALTMMAFAPQPGAD